MEHDGWYCKHCLHSPHDEAHRPVNFQFAIRTPWNFLMYREVSGFFFWWISSKNYTTHQTWRTNTATPRHSGQSWTGCSTTSPWSMPRWCWVGRLDIISRLVATMAGWKINDITNTAPLWRRRSQSGAVFNEGEMKGISGYRFSSNCSTVTVALPSAAKVMPSADWGV